jgi:phage-related protein
MNVGRCRGRQVRVGQAAEGTGSGRLRGRVGSSRGHVPFGVHVRFADRVFVLHAFQKKSKSGVATPKADLDLIKQRLKQSVEISKKKE